MNGTLGPYRTFEVNPNFTFDFTKAAVRKIFGTMTLDDRDGDKAAKTRIIQVREQA